MKRLIVSTLTAALLLGFASPNAVGQLETLRELTGTSSKKPKPKKIARITLKGPITESPVSIPPLFSSTTPLSLKELIKRLNDARDDRDVVALVLDVQQSQLGMGQLEEVHIALQKFRAVDKDVYINADTLTTGSYALASAASKISLVPTGDLWLNGLYGETPYLRGGLDKLGIIPDFEQCGNFKTGAEAITRTEPSEQSQEMTDWLLDSIFDSMVKLIAEGRQMDAKHVRKLIDAGPYSAEEALKAKLIDAVIHRRDFADQLRERYGDNIKIVHDYGGQGSEEVPGNMFAAFEMFMEIFAPSPKVYTEPSVAVVYVEGMIQAGSGEISPFGGSSGAFSTDIRKALETAADDDTVKAVVLRVDSPGGSALASEIILDATHRVADKKPLIVSMGNVAGSGGYYVTCASDMIFADKHTITASIGVLGGKLVTTGFWEKMGIHWHSHQRGNMAGLFSTASEFSDAERAKIRHYMETVYEVFKGHVVDARGDKLAKPIDELAGGRVFTGAQALDLGLVDRIGGLHDAIKYAAATARQTDFDIRVIPEPPTMFDMLTGGVGQDETLSLGIARGIDWLKAPGFGEMLPILARTDPTRFHAVMQQLAKIDLIHRESVVTVMPDAYIIR
ncbi:MAG: S49 family peptidase [Planctomycetota bacterium]